MKKKDLLRVLENLSDDVEIVLMNQSGKMVDLNEVVIVKQLHKIKDEEVKRLEEQRKFIINKEINREWVDSVVNVNGYETKDFAFLEFKNLC
jgi:hypothetical protein